MSILIKGMEMPKRCGGCFLRVGKCKQRIYMEDRPHDCPLIEVPEQHGRLIDADALAMSDRMVGKLMMFGGEYVYTQSEIDNAPTIIEAEGGE